MSFLLNIFGNIKNIVMTFGVIFLGGYIIKQKYNAYQAEDKLKTIENKIAKTNVIIAKKTAHAKARSRKVETDTEVEILRKLKKESQVIQSEMEIIEKDIETHISNKLLKKESKVVKRSKMTFRV